jgi:hypothetical protein
VLTALLAAGVAQSIDINAFGFGATPTLEKDGTQRSYFTFDLQPGASARDTIIVSNSSSSPETLSLSVSSGTTAQGSGGAFDTSSSTCRGSACWVHGLPKSVTVPARKAKALPFSVDVPAGTPLRQYLAGITVQPSKRPEATSIRSGRNGVGAHAVIIHQVNIGVAFTVGKLSELRSSLSIVKVLPAGTADFSRLLVYERNTGETFLKATGTALCLAGAKRFAYPMSSDTILPGDMTTLAVNTPGLPKGANLACTVTLSYVNGAGTIGPSAAAWHGRVKVPSTSSPKVIRTGPGSYAEVPKASIPRWAIALIAVGGVIVLGLIVVIVVLLRRRPPATS